MGKGYDFSHLGALIVDDHEPSKILLDKILKELGVRSVLTARDNAEALEWFRKGLADLLICEYSMSLHSGLDLAKRVRTGKDSPNPYIPVIMITGRVSWQHVRSALNAGVDHVLVKPASVRSLYAALKVLLEKRKPFVRTKDYFGPDRRRTKMAFEGPDRRSKKA
ncbi:MAG: response regulator [Rhodospirillaceae bacterium]